jgi:hypothetical protein
MKNCIPNFHVVGDMLIYEEELVVAHVIIPCAEALWSWRCWGLAKVLLPPIVVEVYVPWVLHLEAPWDLLLGEEAVEVATP